MSLVGGFRSGVGGTRTTGEPPDDAGGTVKTVTSPDGSITVGSPAGPDVTVETTFGGAPPAVAATSSAGVATTASRSDHTHASIPDDSKTLFDLFLSYGHGMAIDANLPATTSFWFSPTTIADLARADQVREWVTEDELGFLELVVRVDAATLVTAGARFVVTVNGADTAIALDLAVGATADTTLETSALFAVAAGSKLGVRFDGSSIGDGSTLRAEIRLRAALTGTPIVPDTLPSGALALFHGNDLAADGTAWTDSVVGHVFNLGPSADPNLTTPAAVQDGTFQNHRFARFTPGPGPDFFTTQTLCTTVDMFAGAVAAPVAARTLVAVVKPSSLIGGSVGVFGLNALYFDCMLWNAQPPEVAAQWVYWNGNGTNNVIAKAAAAVNYGGQELVVVWRTDGTTIEVFINGVKIALATNLVAGDSHSRSGFSIGLDNASAGIGVRGWHGDIVFEGVWAHKFSDAEVLEATSALTTEYVD